MILLRRASQQKRPILFNGPYNSPKLPLPVGDLNPHQIHGSPDPCESAPKPHLDQFSRFYRAHERDQQRDRHTDRPRYSVCSNRPHPAIEQRQFLNLSSNSVTLAFQAEYITMDAYYSILHIITLCHLLTLDRYFSSKVYSDIKRLILTCYNTLATAALLLIPILL